MLKKLANCLILGSLFTSSAFAGDFLAKVSNGALSDNSQGVKALNLDEMKQVKGGYQVLTSKLGNSEYIALAIPDNTTTYKQLVAIYTVTGDNTFSNTFLGYTVKRNIAISSSGKPYVLFNYGVALLDRQTGLHRVNSSEILNNNQVIKELTMKYKTQFESNLGGWTARARR
ncbi:hypothetical protein B9Q65_04730 [Campylobacter jejuni]|uniref:Bacteriocin-type signal sequence domain-containing protein n=2 Tax=Campylobacter jejuni TaxID=197 RepID=A0A5T1BTX3_CAMJU|nr:hypothetical protein [Campylobacter jejuni]EAH5138896.1 hypothetical protein [Campylobacter jejuni]EAH9464428.1 hypothetical protein [Campylobacter jejuni]EAI0521277.1 hypothetical protein [Campylobacter jejuni]EAI8580216.1 hypothetical protein [Campylobacter jejuni]EAJ2340117.1 hypothetical protein [Campylobacter jejuni]